MTCTVDKTAPVAVLKGMNQGYLVGVVNDENLEKWDVFVKKKSAEKYPEEPLTSGDYEMGFESIEYAEPICYLDLRKEPFEPGQIYLIKFVAKDRAGNSTTKTLEFAVPVESLLPRIIPAQIEIDKTGYFLNSSGFIVGTDQQELRLKGNIQGADWYIDNRKSEPKLKDDNGKSLFDEFWWSDILAIKKENDGTKKYTTIRIENGLKETFSFSDDEITGNTGEKQFLTLYADAVKFRLQAPDDAATYQVRPVTVDDSQEYVTVQPGQEYCIADISEVSAFTRSFDIKATAKAGHDIHDLEITLYAEELVNEQFLYSEVEKYAPKNLSVEDKINYKTYLKWDAAQNLPENISYEVYRGTEKDFFRMKSIGLQPILKPGTSQKSILITGKTIIIRFVLLRNLRMIPELIMKFRVISQKL